MNLGMMGGNTYPVQVSELLNTSFSTKILEIVNIGNCETH